MTLDSITNHYQQIEAQGFIPADFLPFPAPELDEGYTVNVCCEHRHAGTFEYPGVILEVMAEAGLRNQGRARVQVWKAHLNNGAGGWDFYTVDLDCLEAADHEIGACMDCGRYDWYANFSDDCECSNCQPESEVVEADEDDAATIQADIYEDDWKLVRR